jgi:phosphoenolpyruvate-protein kinase (PTS system EI component)
VTPVAIAGVKDVLSGIDSERARGLAEKALNASEASEVERMFRSVSEAGAPAAAPRRIAP